MAIPDPPGVSIGFAVTGVLKVGQERQQDVCGVLGAVIDFESAPQRSGRRAEWLSRAEAAGVPWERTAADLHADPVPGLYPVRHRIEFYVHRQDLVAADPDVGGGHGLRAEPPDAVHDVGRLDPAAAAGSHF